jgi:hypothetical protein
MLPTYERKIVRRLRPGRSRDRPGTDVLTAPTCRTTLPESALQPPRKQATMDVAE